MLFRSFTLLKDEPLSMVEATALREIIRDTISNTPDRYLGKGGLILQDAQERFFHYIGIGSLGIDPPPEGLGLETNEIRALWKRYRKEGKLLIDDKDEQEIINKM